MGFSAPSFFTPRKHLIGCRRIDAILAGERLN